MSENKYKVLGNQIYEKIGGPQNVTKLIHCMTRLRITIKDMSKVDVDGLKAINDVIGVVEAETLEIVLGPGINTKVAAEMCAEVGVKEGEVFPDNLKTTESSYQSSKKEVEKKLPKFMPLIKQLLRKLGGVQLYNIFLQFSFH